MYPDPDTESGYGSTEVTESGPNPNPIPDPKHCLRHKYKATSFNLAKQIFLQSMQTKIFAA
jgi:hypothetical protein